MAQRRTTRRTSASRGAAGTHRSSSSARRSGNYAHHASTRGGTARVRQNRSSARVGTPTARRVSAEPQRRLAIPGTNVSLTRRQLILGAAGVAAVAAAAVGSSIAEDHEAEEENANVLEVAADQVVTLDEFETLDAADCMEQIAELALPFHSLVWAGPGNLAVCLTPTETSSPITKVGLVDLSASELELVTVLEGPVSIDARGYDILDVRCSDSGIVWVEANSYSGRWNVYHATLSGTSMGEPTLAEQGDREFDIPSVAAVGNRAFWQVLPVSSTLNPPDSVLKSAEFGSEDSVMALSSRGRMCTRPYAATEGVVVTPRADSSSVHYKLTLVNDTTFDVLDELTMPSAMAPLEAAYVGGRFSFAFDAIYDYGDGLSSLGTYAPISKGNSTKNATWFLFGRNPSAAPAWSGDWLIVKSTRSVSGVNLEDRTMFALDCPSHCDTFGDYLASSGTCDRIATYVHISTNDQEYTLLRTWRPL